MGNQVLKDAQGRRLGEIREQSGRQVIYNAQGKRLGEFDPKSNVTKDAQGRRVGTGNLLTSLLV